MRLEKLCTTCEKPRCPLILVGEAAFALCSAGLQAGMCFLRVAARKRGSENPMISLYVAEPLLAVRQLALF